MTDQSWEDWMGWPESPRLPDGERDKTSAQWIRNAVRYHLELAVSALDGGRFPIETAVAMALEKLGTIEQLLDERDNADRSARISRLIGIEVGGNGKGRSGQSDA